MPQKQHLNETFASDGPARLYGEDQTYDDWTLLFMVEDVKVGGEIEQAALMEIREGKEKKIAKRNVAEQFNLSFRIREKHHPSVVDLLFGGNEAQSSDAATVENRKENIGLFGTVAQRLGMPHGIVSTRPPPTGAAGTAYGTGGLIAADDWKFGVVSVYKNGVKTPHSTPAESASITVAAGEKIAAEWTAPSGITPDHYEVWLFLASGAITDGYYVGSTTAESIVIDNDDGAQDYVAANTNVLTVKSIDEVTTYVANTDYTVDTTRGYIKHISGGDIADGETVKVSYHYPKNAAITTTIGKSHRGRTVKLQLVGVFEDSSGNSAGMIITLYKVDPDSGPPSMPFTEKDFFEGVEIEWECLEDLSEAAPGEIEIIGSGNAFTDYDAPAIQDAN